MPDGSADGLRAIAVRCCERYALLRKKRALDACEAASCVAPIQLNAAAASSDHRLQQRIDRNVAAAIGRRTCHFLTTLAAAAPPPYQQQREAQ
jgi:hypothetical protein